MLSIFSFLSLHAPYLRDSGIGKKTVTLLATSARAFIWITTFARAFIWIATSARAFIPFLFPAPLDQPEIWGSIQPPNSADSPKLPRPFPTGSKSSKKRRGANTQPQPATSGTSCWLRAVQGGGDRKAVQTLSL